jgi:glycine/D-amino acid oxidase-like deaminating enzyme
MSSDTLFAPGIKQTPYWWETTPRPSLPVFELPKSVDVAVIGSGYTGLAAALQTARGGRSTLIFDAEDAGWGCSTRNGGQISTSIKPGFAELAKRHGEHMARAILTEGRNSLKWIGDFIATEKIDCNFKVVGRFHAAHNEPAFKRLTQALANEPKGLETDGFVISRAEQKRELGTDAYYGGVVYPRHASVDPGLLHKGMLDRAIEAGAQVATHCPVTGIDREGTDFRVTTARGTVIARDVVVATNGYTGKTTPWLQRRVIPIGSYVIATEELDPALVDRLFPTDRIVSDTRMVVYYYRLSPDRRRVIFGGRVSQGETDPMKSAVKLRDELVRLFPELAGVKVTHTWMGFVAYTFDTLAHAGKHDGIYYAMGYCGSGVGMAGYLGTKVGQQVLGLSEGHTALEYAKFQTRPLYYGWPWFLAPSVTYYRWRDSRNV